MYSCGESYVVRVYRRDKENSETIIGLVMVVGGETKRFSNREELWSIISSAGLYGQPVPDPAGV